MAAKKPKWPPKTVKPNISGLIIYLQSRVICQNVCFLYMYPIRLLYIILTISIWPPKSKMAAKNRKTNITGLIITLQSRVICQNVCFLYRYPIRLLYIILTISIWPPKSKMAAKNRKTNITGLIIDLQSRVICQNVCFFI